MALQYLQGFDHWPTQVVTDAQITRAGMLPVFYVTTDFSGVEISDEYANGNGKALLLPSSDTGTGASSHNHFGWQSPNDFEVMFFGVARAVTNSKLGAPSNIVPITDEIQLCQFYHISDVAVETPHCGIWVNNEGALFITEGDYRTNTDAVNGANVLYTSPETGIWQDGGAFNYLEAKLDLTDPAAPLLNVWVNGYHAIIDYSDAALKGAAEDTVNTIAFVRNGWQRYSSSTINTHTVLDDLYICDGSGESSLDFFGPSKVLTLKPDNGNSPTMMLPTGADTNYEAVSGEAFTFGAATSYAEAVNVDDQDAYRLETPSISLDDVRVLAIEANVFSPVDTATCELGISFDGTRRSKDIVVDNSNTELRQVVFNNAPDTYAWTLKALRGLVVDFKRVD